MVTVRFLLQSDVKVKVLTSMIDVTLSPRLGAKAAEPSFTTKATIDILPGTQINDSMLILHARLRNAREFMDVTSQAQPMMYAFGHGNRLMSDSPSANLKRHIRYGHFTMNLQAATGPSGVPSPSNAPSGVIMVGEMTRDHDRANLAHAVVGCLALFVIWPLNVLAAGFFKNIKIHIGVSITIVLFLGIAYGLGGWTSKEYNRVSPNPILAILHFHRTTN